MITALFLQIAHFDDQWLRMVQTILLLVFSLLLIYLTLNLWFWLTVKLENSIKNNIFFGYVVGFVIALFDYNLVRFMLNNFYDQILYLYSKLNVGFVVLMWLYWLDLSRWIPGWIETNTKNVTLFITIKEILWVVLLYLSLFLLGIFQFSQALIFDPQFYLIPVLILLTNLLRAFKWISKKTFFILNFLLPLVVFLYIFFLLNYKYF